MKKKLLILGISSFGGASLANFLLDNSEYKIFGTFNKKNKLPFKLFLEKNKRFKEITLFKLDLNKTITKLEDLVNQVKPDYIVDYASICDVNQSWIYPSSYFQINFKSKINFIKNLNKTKNLKKFIYISTPEVFGSNKKSIPEYSIKFKPSTPYACSKLATELLLNNYIGEKNSKIIIARFSNFCGPGQPMHRLLPKLIYCINKKIKFPLEGDGKSKRDFIFDEDFNTAIVKTITKGKPGSKYHFSGERHITINNFIKKIIKIKKYPWRKLIKKTKERKGKDKNYFLNCKKTKHELNWKTTMNLDQGLKISINYYDKIVKYINKKDINNNIKF